MYERQSKDCGLNGQLRNATCACNEGWHQSTEFRSYGFEALDPADASLLPCDTHYELLKFFYAVLVFVAVAALFFHVVVALELKKAASRKKVVSRLILTGVLVFLTGIWSLARLINFKDETMLFGQNPFFTILFGCVLFVFELIGMAFVRSMGAVLVRQFPLLETVAEQRMKKSRSIYVALLFGACVSFIAVCSIPFLKNQAAFNTVLLFFGIQTVDALLLGFLGWYNLGHLNNVISKLLQSHKDKVQFDLEPELDKEILIKIRRLRPKLRRARNHLFVSNCVKAFLTLQVFFWEFSLTLWKYYMPILQTIWMIVTMLTILPQFTYAVNKKKKFAKVVEINDLLS
uniref:Uncharacterized protein n=1 Tax=Aplanochytrium stocchinoi TaxID=215587 RepID=A0A7S3LPS1_9STRA|mmetsp:Transcript_9760/g.12676  ORF Transcript_9760/g.12676 Transcript_9760/m.12676 type:complete len:345 (+) Transcript_9760:105-1139(+)